MGTRSAAGRDRTELAPGLGRALQALGDPVRQRILRLLACQCREGNVACLAAEFRLTRPAVSHHLKVLRDAGLLLAEKRGRDRCYAIDRKGIRNLMSQLQAFVACCCG